MPTSARRPPIAGLSLVLASERDRSHALTGSSRLQLGDWETWWEGSSPPLGRKTKKPA